MSRILRVIICMRQYLMAGAHDVLTYLALKSQHKGYYEVSCVLCVFGMCFVFVLFHFGVSFV